MDHLGIGVAALTTQAEELRSPGASVMHLAVDGRLAGLPAVSDPINPTTLDAPMRKSGLRVVMATGDGLTTARCRKAAWYR